MGRSQVDVTDDTLLMFVGHSDVANAEAASLGSGPLLLVANLFAEQIRLSAPWRAALLAP